MNCFNSLFYIAFLKTYIQGCYTWNSKGEAFFEHGASCSYELKNELIILYTIAFLKNIIELGVPFISKKLSERRRH